MRIQKSFMQRKALNLARKFQVQILPPEQNDNTIEKLIGISNVKQYLEYVIRQYKNHENATTFEQAGIHNAVLFSGAEGNGKTTSAYILAKECGLPLIRIHCEKLIVDDLEAIMNNLEKIFSAFPNAVVLFRTIEYLSMLEDMQASFIFSRMTDFIHDFKGCFFIATVSTGTAIPPFLLAEDSLREDITFNLPIPQERIEFIQRYLQDIPHENINVEKLARDFIGLSGGKIKKLLYAAYRHALIHNKELLDYTTINETITSELYGGKYKKMSDNERRLTAYHEAGHVIAGYFSDPDYVPAKVEIAIRESSLGLTTNEINEDKLSYTKEDNERHIVLALGGKAAEELIFHTSTTGVIGDLTQATLVASIMVRLSGMNKEVGPISLHENTFQSPHLEKQADEQIQKLLIQLYKRTQQILEEHQDALVALAEKLIEKETLYSEEVLEILKPYPRS